MGLRTVRDGLKEMIIFVRGNSPDFLTRVPPGVGKIQHKGGGRGSGSPRSRSGQWAQRQEGHGTDGTVPKIHIIGIVRSRKKRGKVVMDDTWGMLALDRGTWA